MAKAIVKDTGFTVLHEGHPNPELDIVFVHGLQGHPEKTWTSFSQPSRDKVSPQAKYPKPCLVPRISCHRKKTQRTKTDLVPGGSHIEGGIHINGDDKVFWPEPLLSKHEYCVNSRIMTYSYDSNIIQFVKTANFSTISGEGESLLNGLARVREDCNRRPLMLIAHSVGGLIVKSALNLSKTKKAEDLSAVMKSVFAIIFFGTPHRGSSMAEFGKTVARLVSVLTMKPYNDRIVKNLKQNSEILMYLRKDFEETVDKMIGYGCYESSTFQENRGYSGLPGFQNKVVDDDSSEDGKKDRNDHINRNYMNMCKFYGVDDPEYEKVVGEIRRHINRIRNRTSEH